MLQKCPMYGYLPVTDLARARNWIRDEADLALLGSPFTAYYLENLKAHLVRVGSPAGLFEDRVTGGRGRRGRTMIYRGMRHPKEAAQRTYYRATQSTCAD